MDQLNPSQIKVPNVDDTNNPNPPYTAELVFNGNPWDPNPTGIGPLGTYNYNPQYFATPSTALAVASMVGGKVVPFMSLSNSRFMQNQPNFMVQLPSGNYINPGLVATFFTHGYQLSFVKQQIANEVNEVNAGT